MIKVLLADDHKIMREGLRAILTNESRFEVVAEAQDGRKAIQFVRKYKPDVVIMDVSMPDLNGIEATRQILTEFPEVKIIALSMHSDRRFVEGMLRAGVNGYVLKDCASEELITALHCAIHGKTYLNQDIASSVIKDYINFLVQKDCSAVSELTKREREVLQLIAEGKSTKQIADILYLSSKTVETHRRQIMRKLNLYSVAEITKFAIREGITSL